MYTVWVRACMISTVFTQKHDKYDDLCKIMVPSGVQCHWLAEAWNFSFADVHDAC